MVVGLLAKSKGSLYLGRRPGYPYGFSRHRNIIRETVLLFLVLVFYLHEFKNSIFGYTLYLHCTNVHLYVIYNGERSLPDMRINYTHYILFCCAQRTIFIPKHVLHVLSPSVNVFNAAEYRPRFFHNDNDTICLPLRAVNAARRC